MRRASIVPVLVLLAVGCKTETQTPGGATATPGIAPDIAAPVAAEVAANMDPSTNPCDDFYRYACGGWIDSTELPGDQPRYGRFQALRERNQETLKSILDGLASEGDNDETGLGKFYSACMDAEAVEAKGLASMQPLMETIAATKPKNVLATAAALRRLGVGAFFGFEVGPDYKDPTINIAHLSQGGLGMPDRDYYLREDDEAVGLRAAYEKHVTEMLEAAGLDPGWASAVVAFETRLAKASLPRDQMRDPNKRYNRLTPSALAKLTPKLKWAGYFEGLGNPDIDQLNVYPAPYFSGLAEAVAKTDPGVVKAYLQWQVLHTFADHLPAAFVDSNYRFFKQALRGQQAPAPRWKDCVAATDVGMRDQLGQVYVGKHFAGDSRGVALEMIQQVESAFEEGLSTLSWMDEGTQQRAVEKMKAIVNKIGYPESWRDYAGLTVGADHLDNVLAAARFEFDRLASEYGKPVDKAQWHMSPPTVNAYYNPPNNEMVFPAGILQPPFFSSEFPMAMNFGGIGMVMGHELTHGFDDSGRKFDGQGRLTQWWDDAAVTRFEERAECVEELYSGYEVQPGVKLNGKLTLGENIADFGGIKQAHRAYVTWAEAHDEDPKSPALEGLTREQLFFVSFSQLWCSKATPEIERVLALTDPHSHPRYRVNGPLSHLDGFWEAFSCEEGTAMHPPADAVCEVW